AESNRPFPAPAESDHRRQPRPRISARRRGAKRQRRPQGNEPSSGVSGHFHRSGQTIDRKSTRLNSSHVSISYAVFCVKKKNARPAVTGLLSHVAAPFMLSPRIVDTNTPVSLSVEFLNLPTTMCGRVVVNEVLVPNHIAA